MTNNRTAYVNSSTTYLVQPYAPPIAACAVGVKREAAPAPAPTPGPQFPTPNPFPPPFQPTTTFTTTGVLFEQTSYKYSTIKGPLPDWVACCGHRTELYASACNCWGYAPCTTTYLQPSTRTTATANPPVCTEGVNYAYFSLNSLVLPPNGGFGCYTNFPQTIATLLRTLRANVVGIVPWVGGVNGGLATQLIYEGADNSLNVYRSYLQNISHEYWLTVHTAYLRPQLVGNYTFTITSAIDIGLFWYGTKAISNWQYFNYDLRRTLCDGLSPVSFVVTVNQTMVGNLYPFRFLVAKANGTIGFGFQVTGPLGPILNSCSQFGPQIISSCQPVLTGFPSVLGPNFLEWQSPYVNPTF